MYASAAGAKELLEDCRQRLTDILTCDPEDLVFLSGATEANNAVLAHFAAKRGKVAVSAIEHPSVREPAAGAALIPVLVTGHACLDSLHILLTGSDPPPMVSLMAANNETGVIQPWQEALEMCRRKGIPFHCDAAQWLGKLPAAGLGECDFLTGSAHKFGGPKGVGFLKIRGPFRWLKGGPQEERRRAGTENLPGIAAMVAALEAREAALAAQLPGPEFRNAFETLVQRSIPGTHIVAVTSPRLWNTSLLVLPSHANVKWLARLSRMGFEVSTGSACSSGGGASEVLAAMGLPEDALRRVIRVSALPEHSEEDWLALAAAMAEVHASLRDTDKAG